MVKYYGRARTRIGSVNTNQLGLKMSGCPGKVGLNPVNNRYIQHRVNGLIQLPFALIGDIYSPSLPHSRLPSILA